MMNFSIEEMQMMQKHMHEKYQGFWPDLKPEVAKEMLLWMIGETGEVIDVIKKDGDTQIMNQPEVRAHFIEELCDVMMYFNNVMLCYDITIDEFKKAYIEKYNVNMKRW
ncbi:MULTISPECIES: MazG nucleotide pyrophosphohydrolase domain-containing protein [unclassified Breznakia]|uniref:MazG nucleotide pyrophosphohydrolase domain-containing protein n=1 Tax=unclassified Breznakia TaxID=2623764 RepID=UPI002475132F|nr:MULTISPECIES: MazG nucleotide pyrophosphohydrolase domain-containing protein [unclassified Breznakia]MDH6367914.1 NTP pyrophosphatase (non-canonical NTP hydrolase) [Breznakia sp. PH1-1]MDH6405023.1 NTP pyrophosphatase (non-canonical NTP hydrolase) [Breznakia sp. PF1-11]MDH6412717.1 NTP pyrophosphatase (non-canonical NTP hydrolase) [Breznakia sp. PFB1-11]MDH6415098.1 NTP pyrophosphatase (non-canonical NTP hydrolase) [Breznakia sp. PFB1-14]MDH6417388.1 NTP pyrophosphatase (non-canonical NTP h